MAISISGCVYSFSAAGKPAFETLHVSQFTTETAEYQLADRLTDAVIDGLIQDNTVKIREASRADAVMEGSVSGYRRDPYTYEQNDIVTEYAVKVSVHVKVVKANTEDVIWEDNFYAEGVYNADTETDQDGQNRAITQLTADILDRTTKSW